MKKNLSLLLALLIFSTSAFAQVQGDPSADVPVPAGRALAARNSNGADIGVIGIDSNNDTTLYAPSGEQIVAKIAGTPVSTVGGSSQTLNGTLTVQAAADAQRLHVFGGSSDTALTYRFGDGGITAAQTFGLSASTADADDDSIVYLGGGGGGALTDATRGAALTLSGNESTGGGVLQLYSGTVGAASDINLNLGNSAAQITFKNAAGNPMFDMLNSGASSFTSTITSSATSDLGWSVVNAANQACNTTCTSACVVGIDTLGTGGFLGCAVATADSCICAGAS